MIQPEKDFRITRQRRIIIEELRSLPGHPNASELYDAVRRRLPNISLATVYRNLELMTVKGLIQRIVVDSRLKRFDANPEVHYHARCIRCGVIRDIHAGAQIISRLRKEMDDLEDVDLENFEITNARVELLGYCGKCVKDGHSEDSANLP